MKRIVSLVENVGISNLSPIYTRQDVVRKSTRSDFVCNRKIKISCWAFLDGHPVKIMKLSYPDLNQKRKTDQTNHIHFFPQDLTQICTQKSNQKCKQLLNFLEHTNNSVWFTLGWLLDAYRLGLIYRQCALWTSSLEHQWRRLYPLCHLTWVSKLYNTSKKAKHIRHCLWLEGHYFWAGWSMPCQDSMCVVWEKQPPPHHYH